MQERRIVAALTERTESPRARRARGALVAAVAAAVVAADQTTKTWALHHLASGPRHVVWTLQLNLTYNSGIAFSQLTGATVIVTVVGLAVLAALVVLARRTSGWYSAAALGLVIGGAVGNLADRVIRQQGGRVIDFIDLRWWPVFNVADAAITVGVVLAVGHSVLRPRR